MPPLERLRALLADGRTGRRSDPLSYVLLSVVVGGLYLGAARLGIELSVAHGVITPVWAPAGIALAALVLFGPRLWPAIALAALIANATSGASLPEACFISVGNTLEAVVGATLLRRVRFRPQLDRIRDVFVFVLLGAVASTTIAATNGVTTLLVAGDVSGSSYGSEWLLWWSGDGMGDLLVAPLILVWATAPFRKVDWRSAAEGLALLAALAGVSAFVFLAGYWRYPHLIFPLLVWAVLRFQQRGAVTSSFVVGAIAIAGAVHGSTPIAGGSATGIVQILEGLLAAVTVSMLILGAVLGERSTAEEETARARTRLAEAQEVAHIGSWEWDIGANRITWSDELYRIYGEQPGAPVVYEEYLEHLHPADRDMVRETVSRAVANGRPFAYDHRIVLANGSVRWVHGRGRVIVDEAGTPVRMVGTSQDITDRKRLDDLRENILATVSHELRTPLTAIVGFAVTLRERGTQLDEETRAQMIEHVTAQAHRLEGLLSDLLDLDRLRHGIVHPRLRATDVGELVERVVAQVPPDSHRFEVRAEPAVAEVDRPKVERIVENLLTNATKHTPAGTVVSVRVEGSEDAVMIAVDDRGPGVALDQREAVFEIFNRGESFEDVPGAGVGLSLVAQFAAVHGGRAWVEENPGGGASFRVLLPARPPG